MKKNTSTFTGSIKMCLKKYAIIKGRASRSEYWWFQALFVPLSSFVIIMSETEDFESLSLLLTLSYLVCFVIFILTLIPCIAVTIRRFHDTNKSGWYLGLGLIPGIGSLIITVMMMFKGTKGKNKFGPDPSLKK